MTRRAIGVGVPSVRRVSLLSKERFGAVQTEDGTIPKGLVRNSRGAAASSGRQHVSYDFHNTAELIVRQRHPRGEVETL